MLYIGRGSHQTCHALAELYRREPLALDLARVLMDDGSRLVLESAATALAEIAAEPDR